jgi:DNA-binding XRE family transcriptional regulator
MTLSDMSKLIGLKTPSAYYKKENGDVPFSLEEAKIIAEKFNKPLEIFFNNNLS